MGQDRRTSTKNDNVDLGMEPRLSVHFSTILKFQLARSVQYIIWHFRQIWRQIDKTGLRSQSQRFHPVSIQSARVQNRDICPFLFLSACPLRLPTAKIIFPIRAK